MFVVALATVALREFGDGRRALELVTHAHPGWTAAAVLLQVSTYAAAAWALSTFIRHFGHPVTMRRLTELSIVTVFLNNAFPAGGASGATFLSKTLKRDGIPVASSLLLTALYYLASWAAFFVFLTAAFLYLALSHQLTSLQRTLGFVAVAIAVLLIGILTVLARSRTRFTRVARFVGRLLRRDPEVVTADAARFHAGFSAVLAQPRVFARAAIGAGSEQLLDLATVGALFVAFGTPVHVGVLTVGFFLASFITWLSFIPTGLGIFEGSLVGTYVALGVPFEAAAVTVLVYRALSFWLPIPFGFALYRHLLHEAREPLQPKPEPVG